MTAQGVLPTEQLIGRRTIITGGVNTGKTTLTGYWGDEIRDCMQDKMSTPIVAVLDMAPTVPMELSGRTQGGPIGGHVIFNHSTPDLLFKGGIHPPRLMGTSPKHIITLARENRGHIETWFNRLVNGDRVDLLIINDMSIYLQAGKAETMATVLDHAHTVVANGYKGQTLGTDSLSRTEKRRMDKIERYFDAVVPMADKPNGPYF
ncbi:hypothetical protein [Desulfoplanes sp.]